MSTKRGRRFRAFLLYFNAVMTGVWALLIVPTVLLWRDSLLWIALMSVYANFAGSFGAWAALRAERESDG